MTTFSDVSLPCVSVCVLAEVCNLFVVRSDLQACCLMNILILNWWMTDKGMWRCESSPWAPEGLLAWRELNLHWNTCNDEAPQNSVSPLDHFTFTWDFFFFVLVYTIFCFSFSSYLSFLALCWCPMKPTPLLWSCGGDSSARHRRPLLSKEKSWSFTDSSRQKQKKKKPFLSSPSSGSLLVNCTELQS